MSKFDALALAQETLPVLDASQATDGELVHNAGEAPPPPDETTHVTRMDAQMYDMHAPDEKRRTMTQNFPTNPSKPAAEKDPNSSESVEASLEDFISQANASFPAADGWDLHTGDVELVDEDTGGIEPVGLTGPVPKTPASAPRTGAPTSPMFAVAAEPVIMTGQPRQIERTEVVSQPLPQAQVHHQSSHQNSMMHSMPSGPVTVAPAAWTQNPLIVGGIVLGAVIVGASVMLLAMRTMVPVPQPTQVILSQPAPVAAPMAAAPAAPVAAPVAAAPVVTQLPPAATTAPAPAVAAAPVVTQLFGTAPGPAPAPHHAAFTHRPARPAHHEARPAAATPEPKKAAPAAKPAAKEPAKKGNASDWVDPFAN
jgi:hypothetical protein